MWWSMLVVRVLMPVFKETNVAVTIHSALHWFLIVVLDVGFNLL